MISTISVQAAEVNIDTTIHTIATSHNGGTPTVVFVSDQTGYAFYRDSTGVCAYSKTTNGGTVWGAAVIVDAQTDCYKIGVWYDQWTPGDTSGANIHIITMDAGDLWYTKLNTADDSLTTTVNATGANQGGGFAVANNPSVTKSTAGVVYAGVQDAADSFVIKCSVSCDGAANWTEAGTNPFDLAVDYSILLPLSGGNIIAIRDDISTNTYSSKVYSSSGNSWDASWTVIDASAAENGTYDAAFGAAVNKTTGNIYLAYAADIVTLGTNDDIRTAIYSGGAWTAKTDVLTNDAKGITGAKIASDENTGDVYVVYSARTAPGTASSGNVYYKKSANGMTSWDSEIQVNSTTGDIYGARVNLMSNERLYATWDSATVDDLFGNTVVDLTPPSITTISNGINPSDSSVAPGASAIDLDSFTLQTNSGADTVTAATITLATGTSGGLSLVAITSDNGGTTYCSQADPASDTVSLSSCGIPVSTSLTQFKVRTTPKSHANMPVPPGSTYSVTGTVTAYTSTNTKSGADTSSATVTIDNASPINVTGTSGSAGNQQVILNWTNPADSDYHSAVVLRRAGSAVADVPAEGTAYTVGNTINTATVACVVASPTAICTDTGLTNDTAYHYKIFTRDANVNYSTGAVPTGSPFTPVALDITAPAAVSNLALSSPTTSSITVSWTAPGDDNNSGTATSYDLRYSTSNINEGNWASATQVSGEPVPSIAGSSESKVVSGLNSNTTYYFALKTSDEVPNTSAISNVPSLATLDQPPATPANVSPVNGMTINNTLTPTLSASAFSDPDFDAFIASQWQITTISGNYTLPIWDSGQTGPAATIITVGTTLSNNTTYYWHVRYKDGAGLFSDYSSETSFIIANAAPNTPLNIAPSASSTITIFTPLLESSAYSDTEGNAHVGTQWQVALDSGFSSPVFDSIASTGEISRTVPANTLSNNTTYYWRVRYRDNFISDHWSNYSLPTGFLISNQPPATPANVSPVNGATGQNLNVTLTGSAYSDPESDSQTSAGWQVDDDADFATPVWTRTAGTAETSVQVTASTGAFTNELAGKTELDHNAVYYWRVRYSDGAWSNWSAGTAFTTNLVNTPTNLSPANATTIVTLTPLLLASPFSDQQSGHTHATSRWVVDNNADFSSPVYDSGETLTAETSRAVPVEKLNNLNTYYWIVKYKDSAGSWSASSTATYFDVNISFASIEARPIFGNTTVDQGDTVKIDAQVINFTDGSPLNNAVSIINIHDPSGSKIVDGATMTYVSGSNGIYRYSYTIPAVSGSYLYEVTATQGSKSGYGASNFEVRTIQSAVTSIKAKTDTIDWSNIADISADLQKRWTVSLSDFGQILTGKTYRAKLWALNYKSVPIDAVSIPTLTIFDAVRNKVVENVAMTKLSAGNYEYTYSVPSSAVQGVWETVASTTVETGKTIQTNDYWEVEGSPAQVKINSISDNTVPTISANATITNEGTTPFEYHYEYCVVAEQTNSCGGNDDIAYALGAKLINPGQDFISDLALNIPNPGNYYFKIVVYWGTERSGASRQFTAISAPVEASVLATVGGSGGGGGGGGGGGTAQTAQSVSFFDIVWQRITDIFIRIFSTDAKVSQLEKRVVNLEATAQKVVAPAVQKAITPAVSKEVKVSPKKEKFRIKFK